MTQKLAIEDEKKNDSDNNNITYYKQEFGNIIQNSNASIYNPLDVIIYLHLVVLLHSYTYIVVLVV